MRLWEFFPPLHKRTCRTPAAHPHKQKSLPAYFVLLAFAFTVQWLREIIPALLAGHAPRSVTDAGLLTSPVHVVDLSIVLPGFTITGIMLLRRKPFAFVLAPTLITFGILMMLALTGMTGALILKGLATDYFAAAVFFGMAAGLSVLLVRYLKSNETISS